VTQITQIQGDTAREKISQIILTTEGIEDTEKKLLGCFGAFSVFGG
jgi:hypothetical protein